MINFRKKGISVVEVLIVVAIIAIITGISTSLFSHLANSQSLDKETETIVSFINKARNNAINSLEFTQHGVSFASTSLTVFYGTNPATAPTSTTYTLSTKDTIWNINFGNGQSYVYFNKLTGKPNTTGTLQVRHSDNTFKTINIYATGLVEVQ